MTSPGPDFLVIGAQKCGTSWVHENLGSHPGVWLPPEKELHFFDERIRLSLSLRERVRGSSSAATRWRRQVRRQLQRTREDPSLGKQVAWYARYFLGSWDIDWYRSLFRPGLGLIAGEVTPSYSALGRRMVRVVHEALPELQLVLVTRHPIERLWSHANMEERAGGPPADQGAVALLDRTGARARTDYRSQLRRWGDTFGRERLFLGFMEDVAAHPRRLLDDITTHIGASPHTAWSDAEEQVHKGGAEVIPGAVAVRLARQLADEVDELAAHIGGHADWWAWSTRRLAAGDVPDELSYPLWESSLRDEWAAATEPSRPDGALAYHSGRYDTVVVD